MSDLTGQSIGRYHILEQLGEGGMATVYKAFDTRLEAEVAIKFIRTEKLTLETMNKSLKRFEREAKSLAQLTHPNIVGVSDYGEYEEKPYLVMPYLKGGTLKERLGKPMPYRQAAHLLAPIAHALEYAHKHNVLHRDVKPSNILLTDTGQPMLSDFGIAKILEDEATRDLTSTGVGIGTPEYMAPEQGMGHGVDHRVDIYSLGTVLYELITGRKPYQADTPLAVLLKRASEPLPRPGQFVHNLPSSAEYVLLKALAKNPNERYPDAAAFAKALEDLAQDPNIKRAATIPLDRWIGIAAVFGISCAVLLGGGWLFSRLLNTGDGSPSSTPVLLQQPAILSFTQTAPLPAQEPAATPSETIPTEPLPTVTPKPSGNFGREGMPLVYIPEGEFIMGSNSGDSDEQPPHNVYLSAYWIDQTEVTNAMFAEFLNDMGNQSEGGSNWINLPDDDVRIVSGGGSWESQRGYEDYPVVEVTWYGANAYCGWVDRRLPTEAEWEKAARGDSGQSFPWGGALDCSLANYGGCSGEPASVGNYPGGESPYGALDMFGNVWEWVYDKYDTEYYKRSPSTDPTGPSSGKHHILRGAGWDTTDPKRLRITFRYNRAPIDSGGSYGFRCATDSP